MSKTLALTIITDPQKSSFFHNYVTYLRDYEVVWGKKVSQSCADKILARANRERVYTTTNKGEVTFFIETGK